MMSRIEMLLLCSSLLKSINQPRTLQIISQRGERGVSVKVSLKIKVWQKAGRKSRYIRIKKISATSDARAKTKKVEGRFRSRNKQQQ